MSSSKKNQNLMGRRDGKWMKLHRKALYLIWIYFPKEHLLVFQVLFRSNNMPYEKGLHKLSSDTTYLLKFFFGIYSLYKARHAHKRLYTVLPKYSKIQVLPGITSCRLVKDNKQAIELNSLLINNMPKGGYG